MNLTEIDTIQDLTEWVKENLPNAIVVDCDDEIVIQTGLISTMGGYLHEKEEEE
jgi:hypothetical protein